MDTAEIDLRRYIEIVWKWRLVIVLLTVSAVVASGVFSFFVLSPVYETKVTLFVTDAAQSQQSIRPSGDTSVAESVSRIPAMTLNTYMSQITSPYLLDRVVGVIGLPDLGASSIGSMISAQVLKDTSLIEVRVQNTDRALAVTIANTIASEFVQFVSEMNQERMAKSLTFLTEQEAMLKKDLAAAYEELGVIQSRPDNAASIARDISTKSQVVVRLGEDLARLQTDITLVNASLRQIGQEIAAMPATETPTPAFQALVAAQSEKVTQLADSSARASAIAQEVSSLERSLTTLEGKLVVAQNQEAVVKANASRLESTLNLLSSKMVEAQMAHSLNLGEATISVVAPAMEPRNPVKPRKMVNMAVAGVLGGFVSVLLVFVLEYMDNTIKTQDDVLKYLGIGTLGSIPMVDARQRRKR